jgi:hypothetical protein
MGGGEFFAVRQHLYRAVGGNWVYEVSTKWSYGTVSPLGAPAMWANEGYGWETSARQVFTIFLRGEYTVRVDFYWGWNGSQFTRSGYAWASNSCIF